MKFAKTLIAAAMLVGAGSANASIENIAGGLNEAYMSAYDVSTGKTFTFDTGVTYNTLVANVNNAAYSLNYDLSADANWQNFITGANTSVIKYLVVVGASSAFGAAITGAPLVDGLTSAGIFFGMDTAAKIESHATDINTKIGSINAAANLSTLVLDGESGDVVGQHGSAYNVWTGWVQDPQASYGQAVAFQLGQMNELTGENIPTTFAGQWKLAGNSLTFAAPAPASVPLPAAVWMFGAGLMGVLRLNRRKSMAA